MLLILAGVTIATLTGDNGILTKAQNAKTQNDKATAKEKVELIERLVKEWHEKQIKDNGRNR